MTSEDDQLHDAIETGIQRLGTSLDEQVRALVDELWKATRRAVDATEAELVRVRSELDTTEAEQARTHEQLVATQAELARTHDQLAATLEAPVHEPARDVDVHEQSLRLVASIRRLDAARSLTEGLDTLAEALRHEVPRSAVAVMKGAHPEMWHASGFAAGLDTKSVRLDAPLTGVFGRAATLGETTIERAEPEDDPVVSGLPFALLASGHRAMAVPLVIGARVAVVVYADDTGDDVGCDPDAWPGKVEILARHAGRCLEALTVQHAQRASSSV